jgi:hypothetical protein
MKILSSHPAIELTLLPISSPFEFHLRINLFGKSLRMKKVFLCLIAIVTVVFMLSSCAANKVGATKKDCQGVKHYRLKNGIYL